LALVVNGSSQCTGPRKMASLVAAQPILDEP
jgi:hypothetical protein